MSPRSIRRAAERKAQKLAGKEARQFEQQQLAAIPTPDAAGALSEELDFEAPECLANFPLPDIETNETSEPVSPAERAVTALLLPHREIFNSSRCFLPISIPRVRSGN
jgi:hypothetical protein